MVKARKWLSDEEAIHLGLSLNKKNLKRNKAQYPLSKSDVLILTEFRDSGLKDDTVSDTIPNDYIPEAFVLSALNHETGRIMDLDSYCEHHTLPREDVSSYKLITHTGVPHYNIVFKENIEDKVSNIDFEAITKKFIKRLEIKTKNIVSVYDFDTLTYTDVHIGMDTNKDNNSMYAEEWNREEVLKTASLIVEKTIEYKKSKKLIVDELGDLLDGFNAKTTRGGHDLPQNMTNEEAFDCALEFKNIILDGLVDQYESLEFNNICNDNHSGSFGYFVNQAFKSIAEIKYNNVTVNNHRTFLSHYYVGKICFVITHGKDDKTLKFGFKPQLDTTQIEKIDQYCKRNKIYSNSERIIFKKGDSHQAVLDMAGSDDFDYFNYPASSPSSQWVQNNFKKGRRGFFVDNFKGITSTTTPIFI